jgi:signal transduction histidine kinase
MYRLYGRIALAVVVAIIVGALVVAIVLPRLRFLFEDEFEPGEAAAAAQWVAFQLELVEPDRWSEELLKHQDGVPITMTIVTPESVPKGGAGNAAGRRPLFQREGGMLYFPLRGGSSFLAVGPMPLPPRSPLVVTIVIFMVVLTATTSAIVGIPLVRRLRKLQKAIGALAANGAANVNAEGALKELAESVNRMAGQLREQIQERESLLQLVSHEIGTPLSRMRFQAAWLEERVDDRDLRGRIQAICADLDELDHLGTELVAWIDPQIVSTSVCAFSLQSVIEPIVELECRQTHGRVHVDLRIPQGLALRADQRQFQRVIENLLRNALRYAQQRIVIEGRRAEGAVIIEVRDDGPGIPEQDRTRVLEPFVTLPQTSSSAFRRLGLGLSIVRRIVRQHDGEVTVDRAAEGGTAVRTRWPDTATTSGHGN